MAPSWRGRTRGEYPFFGAVTEPSRGGGGERWPLDGRPIHRQDGAYAAVMRTDADECAFDQLVVDAQVEAVSVDGWDFS